MSSWIDPVEDQTDKSIACNYDGQRLTFKVVTSLSYASGMDAVARTNLGRQAMSIFYGDGWDFHQKQDSSQSLDLLAGVGPWLSDLGQRSGYTRRTNFLRSRLPGAPWLWRFQAK